MGLMRSWRHVGDGWRLICCWWDKGTDGCQDGGKIRLDLLHRCFVFLLCMSKT